MVGLHTEPVRGLDAGGLSGGRALDLDAALQRFGHREFRPGQREAIETLLTAGRLLLVAPTGGGKSLTYQLPAHLLAGTTLVISPLIALMEDQTAALGRSGIAATYLASTLDAASYRERARGIEAGDFDLVYVAPERLANPAFRALLKSLECPLVAIDEAHCISEWGHDFRPEYLGIGDMLQEFPKARVMACTATATPVVRDEILARLSLPADTPQIVKGFARPNLSLRAREVDGSRDRRREVDAALAEALGEAGAGRGVAILYAPTRRAAEKEAARVRKAGWRSAAYHAGLNPEVRASAQRDFMEGRLEVIAATNAFGMGIDRPDVRAVIHLGPPASLEAWYQEVGRAGRDGERALGLLLYSQSDFPLRRHLIESGSEDRLPSPELVEHKWSLFLALMRWADGGSCRHDAVLRYFGDEEETLAGCGICDVCTGEEADDERDPEQVTLIVRKALSGVARVHGRFGLGAAVALLHGDRDERLSRSRIDRSSTHGILAAFPLAWLQRLLRRTVTAGWVDFTGGQRPVVVLTESGRAVMHGERAARIRLPPLGGEGSADESEAASSAPGRRRRGAAAGVPSAEELDPAALAIFQALRAWRLEISRSQRVPPYVVASDSALRSISANRPRDPEALLDCYDMGPKRVRRYGRALLALVALHARD